MTDRSKIKNFKIVIEDANLDKNIFFVNAASFDGALRQISGVLNRLKVTIDTSVYGSRRAFVRKLAIKGKRKKSTEAARKRKARRERIYGLVPDYMGDTYERRQYRQKVALKLRIVNLYPGLLDSKQKGK